MYDIWYGEPIMHVLVRRMEEGATLEYAKGGAVGISANRRPIFAEDRLPLKASRSLQQKLVQLRTLSRPET